VSEALRRLPPLGREVVRLPWSTVHPIPEALRAIANRSTTGQIRQRYLNARTFLRALQGWLEAEALGRDGLLELMLDRLRTVGALPALPGMGAQVERLSAMDGGQHINQISHQVLQDMALSFELLREVNSVQVRTAQTIGNEPVLTIRRAISLLGLNSLRHTANGLRLWPGPLSDAGAQALHTLMHQVRLAGCTAQALRPAGYDGEMVYLVTVLQNLGRLLAQYHFPEEAEQIRTLMHSTQGGPGSAAASTSMGAPTAAGWTEAQASYAVLGIDIDALGAAVARHWGLGDEMLRMIRRLPKDLPVRAPDNDADVLRLTASAANEAVDAAVLIDAEQLASVKSDGELAAARPKPAKAARGGARRITSVAQRYLRSLQLTPTIVQDALSAAREALRLGVPMHDDQHVDTPVEQVTSEAAGS
jgi:eukaryotic-like serine/threonine-protein kinase